MHGEVVEVDAIVEGNGDDSDVGVVGEGGGDSNEEWL